MKPLISQHDQMIRVLARYLLGEMIASEDLEIAKEHVTTCQRCWGQLMEIAQVLAPTTWDSFVDEFAEPFPTSPTFAEMRYLQKQDSPSFDLPGIWRRGRSYLARLAAPDTVQEVIISLDPQQWVQPVVEAHRNKKKTDDVTDASVLHITELPGIETSVVIAPLPEDDQEVVLTVEISIPARWPDFSGVRVLLDSPEDQVEKITGGSGRVSFRPVRLNALSSMKLLISPPAGEISVPD